MPLPWAPSKLLDDVDSWSFTNTATSAMAGLADMGSKLMAPVGQQVRQVVEQALPPPPASDVMLQPVAQPVAPREVAPSVPTFSLGKVEDWITPTQPRREIQMPEAAPPPSAAAPASDVMLASGVTPAANGGFSLPPLGAYLPSLAPKPAASASAAPSPAPSPAPSAQGAPPAPGGDLRAYARGVAQQRGLDPAIFERQIQQESKFDPKAVSPAGAQGIAQFMPATAKGVGLADPFEPYSALDAAARHMADNLRANGGDYARALAAYNAGQGNVDKHGGVPPFAETQAYIQAILGDARPQAGTQQAPSASDVKLAPPSAAPPPARQPTAGPAWGTYTPESLTPNQINEGRAQGLSSEQALAICGPAAAVAFARANGRNPTLSEAKDLAEASGVWDVSAGMHGPASEVALLEKMGIPAQLEQGADWGRIAQEVGAGRPVIVDTPGHYYTVNGAYPDGTFELGQSAGVLKASGGRTRFRPEEIQGLGMGAPRATIYARR